jgi:uncharacterized phage protein (TIGR01671 family)|nr:MAG TPA: YopX protein [Caudoviricetes sp.]
MNERYLFKAKRIDNGEWVQGYLYGIWEKRYILWGMTNDVPDMIEVDPTTICQCIGLKDKNGKLIWENDVVKKHFYSIYDSCVNSEEYIGVVKLKDCAWVVDSFRGEYKCAVPIFEAMTYSEDVKYFEVIGNIFDNKESLESEE